MLLPVLAGVAFGWAAWRFHFEPEARRERREAELRKMAQKSLSTLVEEAKGCVRSERWERFPAGERVLALDPTANGDALAKALDDLTREACAEDIAVGRPFGRETNWYEIYDVGIVRIIEELGRRGFPRPSKKPGAAW